MRNSGGGMRGDGEHASRAALFRVGISRKVKKIRPLYGQLKCLTALDILPPKFYDV